MLSTGSALVDAERAFARERRARRRSAVGRRLRHQGSGRLPVYDERCVVTRAAVVGRGVREIPLDRITGTLEAGKASMFDRRFRPAGRASERWQRLWVAEQRGA